MKNYSLEFTPTESSAGSSVQCESPFLQTITWLKYI